MFDFRPFWWLSSGGLAVGTGLAMLAGCAFYQGLLGYPTQPRLREFTLYNSRFKTEHAQALAQHNLPFTGFYYRSVPGTAHGSPQYSYLKFREDGSFFTAFMSVPPEQFQLTAPVDDLGYLALSGDSARYELKSAINHIGVTGMFRFYGDSLWMIEQPTRRKDKPNRLVYRRHASN
jgi:hypothetical protein